MEPVAFAVTSGPRRPPSSRSSRGGVYAPVPRTIRVLSACACCAAVAASALLWLAEAVDTTSSPPTQVAGLSLGVTLGLALAGVPLLFVGPMGKHLSARERRRGIAVAALLPVLCWVAASWPAVAAALSWS
jgi:hypothetical protein